MATPMERRLGEMLVADNVISADDLETALTTQEERKMSLGRVLIEMGVASEWEMAAALGKQLNVPFITLSHYELDDAILQSIPKELVRKYKIVPVDKTGDTLTIALTDPGNLFILDELKLLTKCDIVPVISFESDIMEAIERYYGAEDDEGDDIAPIEDDDLERILEAEFNDDDLELIESMGDDADPDGHDDAPVIQLVNAMIAQGIKMGASDIHIETYEKTMRVRYRVDGALQEVGRQPPKKWQNAIVARLKVMSELDIAERRLPQDGRFKFRFGNKTIDFRVSVCPMIFGEKVVMRILDSSNLQLNLEDLGFEPEPLQKWMAEIFKPFGMCLVTGPTGSGKSTTLYSTLWAINDPAKNISTIEDPVEYSLKGINQVLARPNIGLTFAAGLRSFLRQDPDIIMVGEIRDLETAEIGVKAALTGHLMLSTLHTNDAASTVSRLLNMGLEPFNVTAAVNVVLAQRLARRICKECRTPFEPGPEQRHALGIPANAEVYVGAGCDRCFHKGYKGRVALHEVMPVTNYMRDRIIEGISSNELKQVAIEEGMLSLRAVGMRKVMQGTTTIDEVLAVSIADDDKPIIAPAHPVADDGEMPVRIDDIELAGAASGDE
jgi:type IV pilus assembly protein PilB